MVTTADAGCKCSRDRRVAPAMMMGRTQLGERRSMPPGTVASVPREAITRRLVIELAHQEISRDFRDDRGRGDAETPRIPMNHRDLAKPRRPERKAIDQQV